MSTRKAQYSTEDEVDPDVLTRPLELFPWCLVGTRFCRWWLLTPRCQEHLQGGPFGTEKCYSCRPHPESEATVLGIAPWSFRRTAPQPDCVINQLWKERSSNTCSSWSLEDAVLPEGHHLPRGTLV